MKKNLFLAAICLLTLRVSYGQTNVYHPFPVSNAKWIYNKTECLNPSDPIHPCVPPDRHIYYYILQGDTTVNTTIYHKLYRIDSSAIAPISSFFGGIREDINRKIFLSDFSTPERLLYDFSSTNIGDTLVRGYYYGYPCKGIISSIDSVQLEQGQWRKRYKTTGCGWVLRTSYVIEGIGSNYDLIQGPNSGEYVLWSLRCFHKNNSLVYMDDARYTSSCYLYYVHVGIDEEKRTSSFSISPNPCSTYTTLSTDNSFKDATLMIYNLFGQTLKQMNHLSGQTITLHRDNLPSGLYFIRLNQGNKIIATNKLVITDN